jgi:rhodanese-related sulfurtransferase
MTMEGFFLYVQKSPMNMIVAGLALGSGMMLLWPLVQRLVGGGGKGIGALEAVQMINRRDALVLDVREGNEYAAGHIPNAKHIPVSQLADRAKELEKFKGRPIVTVCASGMRSNAACATLAKLGFAEAVSLRGGMGAWQQAGMPVEKK